MDHGAGESGSGAGGWAPGRRDEPAGPAAEGLTEDGVERAGEGGQEGEPASGRVRPPKRWAWTLVFAGMVPAGVLLMVAAGGPYNDAALRMIGGALLVGAAVIVLWLLSGGEEDWGDGAAGE